MAKALICYVTPLQAEFCSPSQSAACHCHAFTVPKRVELKCVFVPGLAQSIHSSHGDIIHSLTKDCIQTYPAAVSPRDPDSFIISQASVDVLLHVVALTEMDQLNDYSPSLDERLVFS